MSQKTLLLVDGYNVLHKGTRYTKHIMKGSMDLYAKDPFERAREVLVCDVASFAGRVYEPLVVFDGAGNVNPERPATKIAGVKVVFSERGQSADNVIERKVRECIAQGRRVTVVTSDNTIRATAGTGGVACISSDTFIQNMSQENTSDAACYEEAAPMKMTLADRLDPKSRAKLDKMLGRSR